VCGVCGVCGRVGGVGGLGVWGHPLRSNIPRSSLCTTLDTYNFKIIFIKIIFIKIILIKIIFIKIILKISLRARHNNSFQ
jgi:hypothetical protein